jgi:hypothetical protein
VHLKLAISLTMNSGLSPSRYCKWTQLALNRHITHRPRPVGFRVSLSAPSR